MLKKNNHLKSDLAQAHKVHLESLDQLIAGHAINTFFDVAITQHFSRKTQLSLSLREELTLNLGLIQSLFPCVIDCAARVASFGALGPSMVMESETHFLPVMTGRKFSVRVEVEEVNKPHATFSCEIYKQERRGRVRLVECHGTLCAGQPINPFSNVTSLMGEPIEE